MATKKRVRVNKKDPLKGFLHRQKLRVTAALLAQDCVTLEKSKVGVHYQLWNLLAKLPERHLGEWGLPTDFYQPVFSLVKKEEAAGGRFTVAIKTVKGEFTLEWHGTMPLRRII